MEEDRLQRLLQEQPNPEPCQTGSILARSVDYWRLADQFESFTWGELLERCALLFFYGLADHDSWLCRNQLRPGVIEPGDGAEKRGEKNSNRLNIGIPTRAMLSMDALLIYYHVTVTKLSLQSARE